MCNKLFDTLQNLNILDKFTFNKSYLIIIISIYLLIFYNFVLPFQKTIKFCKLVRSIFNFIGDKMLLNPE